jgi:hypothetical protein
VLFVRFIGDAADYILNQLIDTTDLEGQSRR